MPKVNHLSTGQRNEQAAGAIPDRLAVKQVSAAFRLWGTVAMNGLAYQREVRAEWLA
jgi:hypothetical protein